MGDSPTILFLFLKKNVIASGMMLEAFGPNTLGISNSVTHFCCSRMCVFPCPSSIHELLVALVAIGCSTGQHRPDCLALRDLACLIVPTCSLSSVLTMKRALLDSAPSRAATLHPCLTPHEVSYLHLASPKSPS